MMTNIPFTESERRNLVLSLQSSKKCYWFTRKYTCYNSKNCTRKCAYSKVIKVKNRKDFEKVFDEILEMKCPECDEKSLRMTGYKGYMCNMCGYIGNI